MANSIENAALPKTIDRIENLHRFIDHTNLYPTAQVADIERLCKEALAHNFQSVCVHGVWVPRCVELLQGSNTAVCAVVGFPSGAVPTKIKVAETKLYLEQGATKIDMVISLGKLLAGDKAYVLHEIRELADLCRDKSSILRVITEMFLLNDPNKAIAYKWKSTACDLALQAKAHYVKTGTGFALNDNEGATIEDVELMRHIVGDNLGIKAAGKIKDLKKATALINAGATSIGCSASVAIMQEYNAAV